MLNSIADTNNLIVRGIVKPEKTVYIYSIDSSIVENLQPKIDSGLETVSESVVGAINEVNTAVNEVKDTVETISADIDDFNMLVTEKFLRTEEAIQLNHDDITTTNQRIASVQSKVETNAENVSIVTETAETALSIAKGANQAKSCGSYFDLVRLLNDASVDAYNLGQSIYIYKLEVPDVWISSVLAESKYYAYTTDEAFEKELKEKGHVQIGYYFVSPLETQKVDLTDYATKEEVDAVKEDLTNNYAIKDLKGRVRTSSYQLADAPDAAVPYQYAVDNFAAKTDFEILQTTVDTVRTDVTDLNNKKLYQHYYSGDVFGHYILLQFYTYRSTPLLTNGAFNISALRSLIAEMGGYLVASGFVANNITIDGVSDNGSGGVNINGHSKDLTLLSVNNVTSMNLYGSAANEVK